MAGAGTTFLWEKSIKYECFIEYFIGYFRPTMVYAGGMALRSHWCDYYKRQGWVSNSNGVINTSILVFKTLKGW